MRSIQRFQEARSVLASAMHRLKNEEASDNARYKHLAEKLRTRNGEIEELQVRVRELEAKLVELRVLLATDGQYGV